MTFEQNIKNWIILDNKIKLVSEEINSLRNKRSECKNTIITQVQANNLEKSTIKINNGLLKFVTLTQQPALSYKFIENCLHECIKDKEAVDQIIKYIKSKRETKMIKEIKRFNN